MISEPGQQKTVRARDIAVVGMAGIFPEADSIHQFFANLCAGRDSVRELSFARKSRTSLSLEEDYQVCGYIEEIDVFDHTFFGISKREAQYMAPQQRLLLQVVYQALENAGYDPTRLNGLRSSVYAGDTKLEYDLLARSFEPMMMMGNHVSATVGRISRFFGLSGPAAMVDSSCSSSLLAVRLAMNDLRLGEAELALACGANLNLFPDRRSGEPDIGIKSADGRTRCFSAEAAGTGSGEAVACVLLKTLDRALRDGDLVHAVIKEVAVNHVAQRSSTLTAPDSAAQAEVLERAWERAGIDPATISYIEAHGTATRLGDPIEIEALDLAFGRATLRKHFCALSSVKSNIGHTWSAAGIVGLIKAVLALKHRVLFPSLHSANLSPLINFADSAVVVTRELATWEPPCGVRRAGVSSFGVMGTNVHTVLEEAPAREAADPPGESPPGGFWVPVSAKSAAALQANLAALKDWIEGHPELRLADIVKTLVCGRGHFAHRFCTTAADRAALSAALAAPQACGPAPDDAGGTRVNTVLLLSGRYDVSREATQALRRDHPHFDHLYALCEQVAGADREAPRARHFAFQYAFYGLLRHIGLEMRHALGEGAGKHVLDAAADRLELGEALRRALGNGYSDAADLEARVDRLLARLGGEGRLLFIEAGPLSTVSRALAACRGAGHRIVCFDGAEGFPAYLRDLYLGGASWEWGKTAGNGRRIELPSYHFQRIRCWLEDAIVPSPVALGVVREEAPAAIQADRQVSALDGVFAVWKEVLGLEELSSRDSFTDLGGDSISGMQVVNRLQTLFGIELGEDVFFEYDTPLALAQHVEAVRSARQPGRQLAAAPVEEEWFATSPAQLHVWLASQFAGGSVAFNLVRAFRLAGAVEAGALRSALQALAARHEALRCVFAFRDGALAQRALPADRYMVPLAERSLDRPVAEESRLTAMIRDFAARPFDLEQGPLLRAQLLSFRGDQHVLTYSTHHIVTDGWSLDLLTRDLFAFYASHAWQVPAALPPLGGTYRDHHEQKRQTDERREAAAQYWLARFDEEIPPLDLPRRPARGGAFRGACRSYVAPAPLYGRLKLFSQTEGGTVFTAVLSAFAALLSRYAERGELVLGTSVAGRNTEAVEQLAGMFVRTLPLRLRVEPQETFRGLFEHVRSAFNEALRHAAYLYEELLEELQRRGRVRSTRLFDVLIEFEQFAASGQPLEKMTAAPLRVTPVEVNLETSVFPLNIMLSAQDGRLEATIRFDTSLFEAATVDRLWEAFVSLLDAALERPGDPLAELQRLSAAEQVRVRTLGHRALAFDPALQVHHAIERFAALAPDRVCLSCGDEERTYAELNARADQLARFLVRQYQVRPEEIVALVMDRSIHMVEAILALWKCGTAYLPVSPGYTPPFVRAILESSGVRVVILDPSQVSAELAERIPSGCRVIPLTAGNAAGESREDLDFARDVPRDFLRDDSRLAYVIYTSGSTGAPKGVMIEHLGLLNHLHAKIADLSLSERSVIVQNASNSFDISVWQMFAAPFVGGKTVIYGEGLQLAPLRFAARLDHDRATVLEVVPSYLETLLDAWDQADRTPPLDSLEYLVVTGEVALPSLVNRWMRRFPGKTVVNAYGPTEVSDDVTHHRMTGIVEADSVPLGRPIPNTHIYVLDEHLRLCPQGVKGEICVSGICVGRGYLNAAEKTARAFVPDPFQPGRRMYRTGDVGRWTEEGALEFSGRRDSQVKVRGFRIELGAVERRLSGCPAVRAAAVVAKKVARQGGADALQLCAYVVPAPGGSVSECRAFLSRELPEPMIPANFVEIDRLPLTPNGKVDRRALEALELPKAPPAPPLRPRSEPEAILTRIWEQVLGRNDIGVTDRFFDLGGNSLRAMQILSRVRSQMGVELELEALFRQPTIASLAARVATAQSRAADPIPSLGGAGMYDIAAAQELLLHIEETYANRDAFHRNDLYRLAGEPLDPARLERSFARLVERHESLRTTYGRVNGKPVQIVHEPGALALPFRVQDFSLDADPMGAVRRFCERRIRAPFEIAREPLVRVDLMRAGADAFLLLTSMHQLISDGRSVEVFLADWLALYEAADGCGPAPPCNPAPPRLQYKDIAHWRNAQMTLERLREHREFWSRELAGASSILPLRTDHPRPAVSALAGERLRLDLPAALGARIAALANRNGVTKFVVAQCAVTLLLAAETGLTDITIGIYTRGRNRVDLEDQIGFYISTVPLRLRLAPDDSVCSLLARAQDGVLRAFQHGEYPYGWTMRDLGWRRGPERSPVFDVMIAMDDADDAAEAESAMRRTCVEFERYELPRRAKEADLLFAFGRCGDHLEIAVTYNTELFARSRVQERAAAVQAILEGLVENRPMAEILRRASFSGRTGHE